MKLNRTRLFTKSLVSGVIITTATGCGTFDKKDKNRAEPDLHGNTGCLQGLVVDGMTGQRIDIPPSNGYLGLNVLYKGRSITATERLLSDEAGKPVSGEYYLCGLPLNETLPLVAKFDGYEVFQSYVKVSSEYVDKSKSRPVALTDFTSPSTADETRPTTDPAPNTGTPKADNEKPADTRRPNPLTIANIRLFRSGSSASDLSFSVRSGGESVQGAKVYLKPTAAHEFNNTARSGNDTMFDDDHFLIPISTRLLPLEAVTNENGQATFPGEKLVLGRRYQWTALPENDSDKDMQRGEVAVGVRGSGLALQGGLNVYQVSVNLPTNATELKIVSTSLDRKEPRPDGAVEIEFNRDVVISPNSEDEIFWTPANMIWAAPPPRVWSNDASESVRWTVTNRKLILSPVYKGGRKPDLSWEAGAEVIYDGIKVSAASGPNSAVEYDLKALLAQANRGPEIRVRLSKGQTKRAPTKLTLVSPSEVSGVKGSVHNIEATLLDQNGQALRDFPVVFAADKSGTLIGQRLQSQDEAQRVTVLTDENGYARATWTLGTEAEQFVRIESKFVSTSVKAVVSQ